MTKPESLSPHLPVLPEEVLSAVPENAELVCDLTCGFGGHSRMLAEKLPQAQFLLNDQDIQAIDWCHQHFTDGSRITFRHGGFAGQLKELVEQGVQCNFILADLGVSSFQLDTAERGFSFRLDGPLDMRMNQQEGRLTAADIVNTYSEKQLRELMYEFGEEAHGRLIASRICQRRKNQPFHRTADLADFIIAVRPKIRAEKIHPATKVFMALRIAVNQELDELENMLDLLPKCLAPGARAAIISFHSLEDRLVKRCFQKLCHYCNCPPAQPICTCAGVSAFRMSSRQAIQATEKEASTNPRSRSARLRVIEKI